MGIDPTTYHHGAMGREIDPSWWTHWTISTTGVTKAMACATLSVG